MPYRLAPALLLFVLLLSPGCIAVAAGAAAGYGAVQYARNEEHRDYEVTLEEAFAAAAGGLADVGAPVAGAPQPGATEGVLLAADYHVRVEKLGEMSSRVRVRIGTFTTSDHRRRARLFFEAVDRRLGRVPSGP